MRRWTVSAAGETANLDLPFYYKVVKYIGSGAYGHVVAAKVVIPERGTELVAIKKVAEERIMLA